MISTWYIPISLLTWGSHILLRHLSILLLERCQAVYCFLGRLCPLNMRTTISTKQISQSNCTAISKSASLRFCSIVHIVHNINYIYTISTEYFAAQAFLNEEHEHGGPENMSTNENNDYVLGDIEKYYSRRLSYGDLHQARWRWQRCVSQLCQIDTRYYCS